MYFNITNPTMGVLLAIFILKNVVAYISTPGKLLQLVISIPGILIALTFHEFAHAWVADKLGDDTPRRNGRLSLNPLSHVDPFGVILMLTAGFGWGKPVEINSNNFNRKVSIKKGNALVAVAGPCMNMILAIIFSVIYGLILAFSGNFVYTTTGIVISNVIIYTIFMNVGLAIFNLIPLPPLDGSKILVAFLPSKAKEWFERYERILYIVFLVIWITPISTELISPVISVVDKALINLITWIASAG